MKRVSQFRKSLKPNNLEENGARELLGKWFNLTQYTHISYLGLERVPSMLKTSKHFSHKMIPRIVGIVKGKSESRSLPPHVVRCRSLLLGELRRIYCTFPQTKWNSIFGGAKQNDGKNGVSMFKVIFGTKLKVNSLLCTGKTEFSVARKKCQMRNKLRKKTLDQWNANINAPFSIVRNVHATSVTFPSERKMTVFVIVFKKHEWKMTIIQEQI